jgi:hypothetical protein
MFGKSYKLRPGPPTADGEPSLVAAATVAARRLCDGVYYVVLVPAAGLEPALLLPRNGF